MTNHRFIQKTPHPKNRASPEVVSLLTQQAPTRTEPSSPLPFDHEQISNTGQIDAGAYR